MEFYASCSSSSNISSSFTFTQLKVKAVLGNFISATLGLFYAVVSTLSGLITGAAVGQEAQCGYFRGSAVGAVSGALLSIEILETFRHLWESDENGIRCLIYATNSLVSLVNGRLIRESIGPLLIFDLQQIPITTSEEISEEIFEAGKCKGLSFTSIEITTENHADFRGESISCELFEYRTHSGSRAYEFEYLYRTCSLARKYAGCHAATTCFMQPVSTSGSSDAVLVRYVGGISDFTEICSDA